MPQTLNVFSLLDAPFGVISEFHFHFQLSTFERSGSGDCLHENQK